MCRGNETAGTGRRTQGTASKGVQENIRKCQNNGDLNAKGEPLPGHHSLEEKQVGRSRMDQIMFKRFF